MGAYLKTTKGPFGLSATHNRFPDFSGASANLKICWNPVSKYHVDISPSTYGNHNNQVPDFN